MFVLVYLAVKRRFDFINGSLMVCCCLYRKVCKAQSQCQMVHWKKTVLSKHFGKLKSSIILSKLKINNNVRRLNISFTPSQSTIWTNPQLCIYILQMSIVDSKKGGAVKHCMLNKPSLQGKTEACHSTWPTGQPRCGLSTKGNEKSVATAAMFRKLLPTW